MFSMMTDLLLIVSLLALLFSISAGTYIFLSYCCPQYEAKEISNAAANSHFMLMSAVAQAAGVNVPSVPPAQAAAAAEKELPPSIQAHPTPPPVQHNHNNHHPSPPRSNGGLCLSVTEAEIALLKAHQNERLLRVSSESTEQLDITGNGNGSGNNGGIVVDLLDHEKMNGIIETAL